MTAEMTRRARRRARRARTWRDCGSLAAALPLWAVPYALLSAPWVYTSEGTYDAPTAPFAVTIAVLAPFTASMFLLSRLTRWQRARLRSVRGVTIADAGAPQLTWSRAGAREALQSEATWRQALYHFIVGPAVGTALFILGSIVSAYFVGLGYLGWLISRPADSHAWGGRIGVTLGTLGAGLGLPCLFLIPRIIRSLSRADTNAARLLLGPNHTVELARRVDALSASRAAAVDAADSERRRIERDLHDGAQQQLMSLAVNLGLARKTLRDSPGVPDEALKVIASAHEQAKEAMAELRDLVRGLHPAVLDDRGLDAALSGVAARSAVPVQLTVDLRGPLPAAVETVAYFVVSEALANVVKHSGASQASVDVHADKVTDVLVVRIEDDGAGGADPTRGTGLAGLAQRVASVDGALRVSSPTGGPTVLTAELPCRT